MRALALSLLFILQGASAAPAGPDDWSWLAGDWHQCKGGEIVEERWFGPRGGLMIGANLTSSAAGKATFETLRIVQSDGVWTYWASPMGRPAVPFRSAESSSAQKAVFENAEHVFPARVSYWRDGADLMARIEGTIKGQAAAKEWRFSPGAAGADCAAAR